MLRAMRGSLCDSHAGDCGEVKMTLSFLWIRHSYTQLSSMREFQKIIQIRKA